MQEITFLSLRKILFSNLKNWLIIIQQNLNVLGINRFVLFLSMLVPVDSLHVCNKYFHYCIIKDSLAKSNLMFDIMHFSCSAFITFLITLHTQFPFWNTFLCVNVEAQAMPRKYIRMDAIVNLVLSINFPVCWLKGNRKL